MTEKQEIKKAAKFYSNILNQRIRELLEERKIKTDEFAKALSISSEAVRLWVAGYARPDIDKIYMISKYFNVTSDYLLGLSDVKSFDMEIKAISDKTGLSEGVIGLLMNYSVSVTTKHKDGAQSSHYVKARPPKDINRIIGSNFFWNLVKNLWILKNIRGDKLPEYAQNLRHLLSVERYREYVIYNIKSELESFIDKAVPFEATTEDRIFYVDEIFDGDVPFEQIYFEENKVK